MSISDRDLEALSAYLDGVLSGKERERLETRIQRDQELQDKLEQLQRTMTTMRSLPVLRAPRNYYLTPEMVGEKQRPRRAFPVLRFVSALATLLFVLVFLSDLFILPTLLMAPSSAVQFAEQAVEEAEQTILETDTTESQLPDAPAEKSLESFQAEGEAAPAAAEAILSPTAGTTPEFERLLTTAIPSLAEEMEDTVGAVGVEEPNLRIETSEPLDQSDEALRPGIDFRRVFRITEIILVLLALMTGLAAFFLFWREK